jgi:ABC-type Mn2+/Zn2+ transport system permease subunit
MRVESLLLVAAVLLVPAAAAAYVDPGTGSMFFQAAIASLLAALFTLKMYWRRLKNWFVARKDPAGLPKDADGGR